MNYIQQLEEALAAILTLRDSETRDEKKKIMDANEENELFMRLAELCLDDNVKTSGLVDPNLPTRNDKNQRLTNYVEFTSAIKYAGDKPLTSDKYQYLLRHTDKEEFAVYSYLLSVPEAPVVEEAKEEVAAPEVEKADKPATAPTKRNPRNQKRTRKA